ncbi:hypothetical protein XENOCAPTIV_011990 [Xenoophorus captivus]|uniref:Family with sequence similarity 168 member B n=1 Tax=Xenoophorus captivus TaxID=1517983 RepID=A0ABV0RQA7_9TELE
MKCFLSLGYATGTAFKMSCSPNTGTVPPYSSSPNPYPAAVYPVRSTYPQQSPYAQALIPSQQQGTYYTQPLYAAPPHVIHHTTVVQPNGMPAAMYAPPIPSSRPNGVTMGMVAGTTMAMSAGELQWFFVSNTLTVSSRLGQNELKGDMSVLLFRNFVLKSITSTCCPPSSYDAHISAPWYPQLQLCAPAVVKRLKREYSV